MGIGEALAEARSQAGLTVTEVSQRTRIRETIIRGIEGDDYSVCGGDLYARANIRSIAGAVGADPEPLIREYDEVCRVPGALSAVSLDELFTAVQTSGAAPAGLGTGAGAGACDDARFGGVHPPLGLAAYGEHPAGGGGP